MELVIRYVRSGGVSIAYQVLGEGETDLVFVPDFCSNLVYAWESPYWRPFYERLAQSFRLILFDKRRTGLSDHKPPRALGHAGAVRRAPRSDVPDTGGNR